MAEDNDFVKQHMERYKKLQELQKQEHLSWRFKGVWIPREIWLNEKLSILEKALWATITHLGGKKEGDKGCYASNEYLSTILDCSERHVRRMISNLKDLGYIEEVAFDGRTRWLDDTGKRG